MSAFSLLHPWVRCSLHRPPVLLGEWCLVTYQPETALGDLDGEGADTRRVCTARCTRPDGVRYVWSDPQGRELAVLAWMPYPDPFEDPA